MTNRISLRNSCSLQARVLATYLFFLLAVALFGHMGYHTINAAILWVFGPILAAWLFVPRIGVVLNVPFEYWAYSSLMLFALLGLPYVIDYDGYWRYQQVLFANAVLMIVIFFGVSNEREWLMLWKAVFFAGLFVAAASFFFSPVGDVTEERLTGLAANANGTANYSRVSILAALLLTRIKMRAIWRIMLWLAMIFLAYIILITASRGTFLNLMFILGSYIIMRSFGGWKVILLLCVLLFFGNYLLELLGMFLEDFYLYERFFRLGSVSQTVEADYRFELMREAWDLFWQRPFLGVGLNQFRIYSGGMISHTDFLDIFVQLGFIAGLVYVSIYVQIVRRLQLLKRIYRNRIGGVIDILLICLISEIIYGISNPNWFSQLQMVVLSLLIVGARRIFIHPMVIAKYSEIHESSD